MGDVGDEEASETVADLPRFEADAEAVREADLRAAAAATAARDGVPRDGVPRLGNGKPRITTTAPWAMGAGRPAPPARQRRTAAPWAPPAPGKPGTSPTKQSAVGLGSMPTMGRSLPPHQCATTTTAPSSTAAAGVPGQLPGSLRQTQQPARGGHDLRVAVRRCGHSCAARRMPTMPGGGARVPEDVLLDGAAGGGVVEGRVHGRREGRRR